MPEKGWKPVILSLQVIEELRKHHKYEGESLNKIITRILGLKQTHKK